MRSVAEGAVTATECTWGAEWTQSLSTGMDQPRRRHTSYAARVDTDCGSVNRGSVAPIADPRRPMIHPLLEQADGVER